MNDDGRARERFLARLYTEPAFLERFLAAPVEVARAEGFVLAEEIDAEGLRLTAHGFAHKREAHAERALKPRTGRSGSR